MTSYYRMAKRLIPALLALLAAFPFSCSMVDAAGLVIYKSHEYLSRDYQVQNFQDMMGLAAGQQNLPLTLSIYNGSHELPSFKWFRLIVNGQILATEKDLNGKDFGTKNVTGLIEAANLQVQVQAAGVPGAALWWTLSTVPMELNWANPTSANPGQKIMLGGSNFPTNASGVNVLFNGQPAPIVSSTGNTLTVQVPSNTQAGVNHIQVSGDGLESNQIALTIISKPVPELLGIDCWMAPPGGTINITGRNFSVNSNENQVFFGDVQATISFCSPTQLTVIVPNWPYGPSQLNIPVSVVTDGVRSANRLPFDIGPMYHGATPQFGHD